jgi:hypothetical protein
MADENGNLTEAEAEAMLRSFAETKETSVSFFTNVIKNDDTSKTGNLTNEELGIPQLPVRTLQQLQILCKEVFDDTSFAEVFGKQAEEILATSLSREGFLLRQVGTSKKEIADVTPRHKENSGWFRRKNKPENQ